MKKLLLLGAAVVMTAIPMAAKGIWDSNKGITIGIYTHQGLKAEDDIAKLQYDSNFGIGLSTGTSYLWPRSHGWAGDRIKVGVDVRWFDLSYINYKKDSKIDFKTDVPQDGYDNSGYDNWDNGYDDGYDEDMEEDAEFNLGTHQLHIGMGVGPVVSIAPLAHLNNAARYLRANVYAHFDPQASLILYKDYNDDTKISGAFVPMFDCGVNFQWKFITLGFEGRWGQAKYKSFISDNEDDWDTSDIETGGSGMPSYKGGDKETWKNASFRINIGFRW